MFQLKFERCVVSRMYQRAFTTALALVFLGVVGCVYASSTNTQGNPQVRVFLQKYMKRYPPILDSGLRYSAAAVSLNGNSGGQYFVYLSSRWWCGSGGCTALLLEPQGTSFRVIDRFTLARLPIRVLPSKTNGWHDLSMPVEGGGILPGYFAILKFDGHNYPSNPSMAPKLPENLDGTGVEVPLSEHGSLVY